MHELRTRNPITFTDPLDFQNKVSWLRANLGINLPLGRFGLRTARKGIKGYFGIKIGIGRPGVEVGIPESGLDFLKNHPGIQSNTNGVLFKDRVVIPKVVDPHHPLATVLY